ncbi:hypothetical protein EDF57_103546 [Novosphingobium sp. PhB55]|uniref:hypothetical protein n=1 Tax=Novosphingobium sp. PhB55 TaxID=2485106 RepID=UPI00106613BB|nr:hypothetical protein [Novosphingobium sp. PhB55]TDW65362.1 hypothetical protein EDF57_103546 [Novosphingobium sp. PhB55]
MAIATVSAPSLVSTITLRVRFIAITRARLRIAAPIIRLGAWVAGCQVEIDIADPTEAPEHP